jgi:hypothetical protein
MNIVTRLRNCRTKRAIRMSSGNGRFYLWRLKNFYWPELASAEHFASEFSKSNSSVFFVRLGAERDILTDAIHRIVKRDSWKGLIAEPSQETFNQIVKPLYYNRDGIKIFNAKYDAKELIKLLNENGVKKIDWYQTSMGDQNLEILKALDSENIIPGVIAFENHSMKPETIKACVTYLSEKGYKTKNFGKETVAAMEDDEYLARFLAD